MLRLQAETISKSIAQHGFFGRSGGVSTGIFASLNCGPGSGDDRSHVVENRRRALAELTADPSARLLTLYQIHSAEAVAVTAPWEIGEGPKADAMATNDPGVALGILTADCAPVLLVDAEARVIGAAHAGWKGAFSGVIESVLEAMEQLGASRARIAAAVGPCISQENYEVGPEFVDRFRDSDGGNSRWFAISDRPDHFRFDLPGYVRHRLEATGVVSAERIPACTYAEGERFFSFRRATHRGEKDYGRQLSAILLTR